MLFTRLWIVVLALVAGVSVTAAMLARSIYDHDRAGDVGALVEADRRAVDEFLRRDARTRLDDLAPLSGDAQLVTLLAARANATDDSPRAIGVRVTQRLRALNDELGPLKGDVLIAVDRRGIVVGRVGPNDNELGGYLGGIPLVERALSGSVRDDVWELGGAAYRMAARPVISEGRYYVGAIVHGMAINQRFVEEKVALLVPGATVVFFGPGGSYAGVAPTPERGGTASPTVAAVTDGVRALATREEWTRNGTTRAIEVGERAGMVSYAALPGVVGASGGGVAVARGLPTLPGDFLLKASKEDFSRVPIALLSLGALLLAGVGILLVYAEYDAKKKRLAAALEGLRKDHDRLDPLVLSGFARDLAVTANEGIDAVVKREVQRAGGRVRDVGDLESLLSVPSPQPGVLAMSPQEEQRHWREVYDQFLARRRELGEGGDPPSWEKFTATLQRSKRELQSRTGAAGVRFTAQVKDGRAGLRASPITV